MQTKIQSLSPWRIGTAALVICSILGSYLLGSPRSRKRPNQVFKKTQEDLDENLIAPANATFPLVWTVIYLGKMALAVHQALPSQQNNPRYQAAQPWLCISYGLNALFGYFFSQDTKIGRVGSGLTTIAMLPPALMLHKQLAIGQTVVPQPEKLFQKAVSLYTGWLTVASAVGITNLLLQAGYRVPVTQASRWAYGVLPVVGVLGITVAKQLKDPYYLLPFVAAFSGITAKQYHQQQGVAAIASLCALVTSMQIGKSLRKYNKDLPIPIS